MHANAPRTREGREVLVIFHSQRPQNPTAPLPHLLPGCSEVLGLFSGCTSEGSLLRAESISPASFPPVGGTAAAPPGLQPIYGRTPWSLGVCVVFNH